MGHGLRWWCQKALPSVYDESLSYYEVLCKLIEEVKTLKIDGIDISNFVKATDTVADIDNIDTNTVATYYANSTVSNIPANLEDDTFVLLTLGDENTKIQLLGAIKLYYRIFNGEEWSEWKDLSGYVTSDELETILAGYVTSNQLDTALEDKVTTAYLTQVLASYCTTAYVDMKLLDYIDETYLQTALQQYVTTGYVSSHFANKNEVSEFVKHASVSLDGNTLTLKNKDNSETVFRPRGGEVPERYIKTAVVSADNSRLTLTKENGVNIIFEPSGGGGDLPTQYIKNATVDNDTLILEKNNGTNVEFRPTSGEPVKYLVQAEVEDGTLYIVNNELEEIQYSPEISGGYVKAIKVSEDGKTLTAIKSDDTNVSFSPIEGAKWELSIQTKTVTLTPTQNENYAYKGNANVIIDLTAYPDVYNYINDRDKREMHIFVKYSKTTQDISNGIWYEHCAYFNTLKQTYSGGYYTSEYYDYISVANNELIDISNLIVENNTITFDIDFYTNNANELTRYITNFTFVL